MILLHAIHDFLPRHAAGSEIYAFELCRELSSRHHVNVMCAEYAPALPHGHVQWGVHEGLTVIEIANNWEARTFEDSYRAPRVREQIGHVLHAVQPDVLHLHSLLNLTFDLPALAKARGIPVVATLHDYTLVCPSGGQRLHAAEQHVCETIDFDRCARCFAESPLFRQMSYARVAASAPRPAALAALARTMRDRFPIAADRVARGVARAVKVPVTADEIRRRFDAARRVFDQVDMFVSPSRSLADEYIRLGVEAARIRVSDYGIPFSARAQSVSSPAHGRLRIGYVGTIVRHKGVHTLIDAVRALDASSYEVLIYGDPAVSPAYASDLQASAAGLPVSFKGAFSRDRVADVYATFDVLVVPSLWLENSPLVVHEAFVARRPVVAARIGGLADLIVHGVNGLLYDPSSTAALTAALQQLIDRPQLVCALADGVPAVKSMRQDAQEWEQVYEAALSGRAN